jgi:hypothetical protein
MADVVLWDFPISHFNLDSATFSGVIIASWRGTAPWRVAAV